jgi:hypothetical protein
MSLARLTQSAAIAFGRAVLLLSTCSDFWRYAPKIGAQKDMKYLRQAAMIQIEPFRPEHLPHVRELVGYHLSAVVPG